MRIGVAVGVGAPGETSIDGLARRAAELERAGLDAMWMGMAWGMDPTIALAVAGRGTTRLRFGSAIVPTLPRHPVVTAQQARTTQAALGGRFTLGIGVSHETMMRASLGLAYDGLVRHLREYLTVLEPLLAGRPARYAGSEYQVDVEISVESAPVSVLVAALGPRMLSVTGELADGTITAWVGVRTIESYVVPTLHGAAAAAGRPTPRIVAILPIALTDDPGAAREALARMWSWYGTLPAFQAMFDREGATGPADVALIGDESTLDAALARMASAGVTDYVANLIHADPATEARTFDYLVDRARRR